MAVNIDVISNRSPYIEGPPGYFTYSTDLVENPTGSGLFTIPISLVEDPTGSGLYLVPEDFVFENFFAGSGANVKTFSVQEDATPVDPSDSAGGVGQITFAANSAENTTYLIQELVELDESYNGKVWGVVRSIDDNNGDVTVTADSVLALFNSDHVVPPMVGKLGVIFQAYCNIVDIPNAVVVDSTITNRNVVYPGFSGNLWFHLKQICAKEQIEVALVYNTIVLRPLRQHTTDVKLDTMHGYSVNNQATAKKVEVNYYNHVYGSLLEVYPLTTEEPSIYQVDAGETLVVTQQLNASMMSVNQPQCISFVEDRPYPNTNGVYSVAGNDGKPITPAQWTAQGGSVVVAIAEDDPSTIEITITGASMEDYAPYRIAMTAGTSSYYNSLHITGTGVVWDKKSVVLVTGATSAVTGEEIGITVDNPFISTYAQALNLGMQTAKSFAGTHTISGSASQVGDAGEPWVEQTFGTIAGSRIKRGDAWYRTTNATVNESGVQYSANMNTLVSDFNTVWAGKTVADFNTQWEGRRMKDFNSTPVRRNNG